MPEAKTHADTYHRHDSPPQGDEQEAVTGRANDTPLRGEDKPAVPNSTFAERAKAAKPTAKKVDADDTQNKAVSSARKKAASK